MERVVIKNLKGQNLAGIFYPSKIHTDKIIVVCHGLKGTKEGKGKTLDMALRFSESFNVLLFDFRGCGESEGNFEDITLTGQIEDLNCVVDWAFEKGYRKIGCIGRSFGGTTVICAASGNKKILSVASWAAPSDLEKVFDKTKYPKEGNFYTTESEGKKLKIKEKFFEDLKNYNLYELVKLISPRPVLFVQGDKDNVVPVDNCYKLYNEANEPKKMYIVKGDDHIFSKKYKEVWEITYKWFEETLK